MSAPINRKSQKNSFRMMEILSYLMILFAAAHIKTSGIEGIYEIEALLEHIIYHPFDIFPLDKEIMLQAAGMGLLVPLYLHSEYLRRRDLRPNVENGSAQWNEDLKGFIAKYCESYINWPRIFNLPVLRNLKAFMQRLGIKLDEAMRKLSAKAKGKDGEEDKKLLMKIYTTYQNIYAKLTKPWQTLDKVPGPGHKNMIFSKEVYMSMDTRKTRRNNNILIIGGSGTGKSATRFCVKYTKHRHTGYQKQPFLIRAGSL